MRDGKTLQREALGGYRPDGPTSIGQKQQLPRLQTVDWLAQTLGLSTGQTYEAIASKKVPGDCILRVGRRIRLIEERVIAWILRGDQGSEANYAS